MFSWLKGRRAANESVAHGIWGESVAASLLRSHGYVILGRNVRPSVRDRRLEIDIVAYEKATDCIVFVEVKQHAARNAYQSRMRSVNRRKLDLLRKACRAWLRTNRWRRAYRFDVVEVYGLPGEGKPEVDHIERVNLFTPAEKFVNWND